MMLVEDFRPMNYDMMAEVPPVGNRRNLCPNIITLTVNN